MDQPLSMFKYWEDNYFNLVLVVEQNYPSIAKEPEMAAAIAMVRNGERLIASIMAQKVGEAEDMQE